MEIRPDLSRGAVVEASEGVFVHPQGHVHLGGVGCQTQGDDCGIADSHVSSSLLRRFGRAVRAESSSSSPSRFERIYDAPAAITNPRPMAMASTPGTARTSATGT